jgi:hypothetical protein
MIRNLWGLAHDGLTDSRGRPDPLHLAASRAAATQAGPEFGPSVLVSGSSWFQEAGSSTTSQIGWHFADARQGRGDATEAAQGPLDHARRHGLAKLLDAPQPR